MTTQPPPLEPLVLRWTCWNREVAVTDQQFVAPHRQRLAMNAWRGYYRALSGKVRFAPLWVVSSVGRAAGF